MIWFLSHSLPKGTGITRNRNDQNFFLRIQKGLGAGRKLKKGRIMPDQILRTQFNIEEGLFSALGLFRKPVDVVIWIPIYLSIVLIVLLNR